jgi:predicted nucleic acid-binding protein
VPKSASKATTELAQSGAAQPLTLIDASALIALLGAEPAAAEVSTLLKDEAASITTLNLAEAVDRLKRRYDLAVEQTRPVIEGLLAGALDLIPIESAQAWRAAEIRASHYHRKDCPISMADAVLVASAPSSGRIASSDSHVLSVGRREGVSVIVLPDSQGRRAKV